MTPNYAVPLAGLLFVGTGVQLSRLVRRGRTSGVIVSGVSAWLGVTLLTPPNGSLVDHLTDVDQLGTFLGSLLITFAALLHGIFMLSLMAPRWARWRSALLAGYGVFFLAGSTCWIASHQGTQGSLTAHFAPVSPLGAQFWFAATTIGYLATVYSFAPAFAAYSALSFRATKPLFRGAATLGALLFAPGVANGLIGIAATLRLDPRSLPPGHVPFASPLVSAGITLALAVTALYALGGTARQHVRSWLSLATVGMWARRNYRNMVNANVYLSERRVFVTEYINHSALCELATALQSSRFTQYQQHVGMEAARWLALNNPHFFRSTHVAIQEAILSHEELLRDALGRADRDDDFYADVYRVVALVLGTEHHPVFQTLPELPGWRSGLARLIKKHGLAGQYADARDILSEGYGSTSPAQ